MALKKTKIIFEFDNDSLKELRKVLFKKNLCPQQFFTYIVEMSAMHEDRLIKMMDETVLYKEQYAGKKRQNNTDAEVVYKLIEEQLKENKQNGV